ncbi:hypothetical protein UFOVP437_22 [uncultured Caudovirales phage]|uniref:Uncharacterized protein n=1 Tax=uncultured Caudovirales phage TaxID=2100421 RepID=A0A6J5MC08_9CAUD|nr:hypothetical protein UFOVP437_22 [uncultured Caudovirales phage]
MAGTLALNVEILGGFSKLTAATKGATSQLSGLSKTATSISQGMNKAFGLIGVGFSLNFLKNELAEASKAAVQDAKSMEILSIAMQNTGKATAFTVKEAEDSIRAMSLEAAVADDVLRPAYQKLFIATGNVADSNRYLQVALDASAATGKDLDSVTQAMAKSLAGQDTALIKLIPSLRNAKDPLAELEKTFAGAATAAANLDPYQRMNVAFGEIQESVGTVLLPVLNDFADFLVASVPRIQAFFAELLNPTTELGNAWQDLGAIFADTTTEFNKMLAVFGVSGIEFKDVLNFVTQLTAGFGQLFFFVGRVADIIGSLITFNFQRAFDLSTNFGRDYGMFVAGQNAAIQGPGVQSVRQVENAQNITINVNNGNVTAQEIADKINRGNRATGTNLIRGF